MEAGTPNHAALRLAVTGGGVALTIGLLIATAYVAGGGADPPAAASTAAADLIETGASYELPQAATALTPVSIAESAYEAPLYEEPSAPQQKPVATPAATPNRPSTLPARAQASEWAGPLTIHNPAAFGPPEDDSIPPVPTNPAPRPERLANRAPTHLPALPALVPPAGGQPPVAWAPAPPLLGESTPVAEPEAPDEGPTRTLATAVRPLQDLAPSEGQEELLSYTASTNDLSKRLSGDVQAGFKLGKSGAVYAARSKFVSVLRQIAQAKDAEAGSNDHTTALAEGLRTLDDADDFVPRGNALEAELDVAAIASSHGLRLVGERTSSHEAIARYSQHAAAKLAQAAAGEPAGSMALYGLGKSYARLEAQGDAPTAGRKGTVMFRAAVNTNTENYLAANELGVRLARAGRYQQASKVLRQAASQPSAIATIHANLAAVEQRIGNDQTAALAKSHSEQLAQSERASGQVSRRLGVEWVAPDQFRRGAPQQVAAASIPSPHQPAAPVFTAAPPQRVESGWSGFVAKAKRATGWSNPPQPPVATGPPAGYGPPPWVTSQPQPVIR